MGKGGRRRGDGAAALDAFEEDGFLAADVAAGAATDLDAEARGVTSLICAGALALCAPGAPALRTPASSAWARAVVRR